ncbi:MAG: hypothetical protein K9G65_00730 [Rickettsiaceae bacterium]|jgi:hypothetical protein|nr:hypothetical protein [Rickettsiaceae bacterium]
MEKNLLIFISIVLLNSASSYADKESELPALPTSFEVQVEEKSGADSSKSLWQKFKEYFGFGEEKKIEKNQPDTPLAVRKKEDTEHAQSESINDEQVISNKENYDTIPDSIPPIGSTDEGPMNVKLPEYEKEDDVPDQIKLPDSFGEDIIKNPDSSTSANEPIQDITNPGENTRKNDAPVVSKTPDHQAEEKNVTAKDTIEPKTEELTIPQLSETGEVKEEASFKNNAATETIEPKTEELTIPQLPGAGEVKEEASLKNDAAKEITASKIEEMPTAQEEPVVKLELPAGKPAGAATPKPSNIDVPEYAGAASQPNEEEVAISKYKESLETKSSKPVVVPKLSESELSLENKSKQVDLKASDLEAFDTDQLKFVNNEAQVLILPNDDIVLGTLIEEAKLDQIDFRAYVDKFWENYNRLKREPKRLEIEKFIYNYDELFDTNN